MPKKMYIAGLIAAGAAAAVTVYAVRRRRDKAVDQELAGMLDDAEIGPAEPSPKAQSLSGAHSDAQEAASAAYQDVMAATPAEVKASPASPA